MHLISLKGMGGRAATALRQARLLSARGHRVLVGCLPGTAAEQRSRDMGLTVFSDFRFSRGFRPFDFWHDYSVLARRIDSEKVDVVHAHLSQESWVACLAARRARRRPVVIRSRGVVVPIQPHAFNRWLHNSLTDQVITPSRVIYDHLRGLPGFDEDKIKLLYDGVDIQRFKPRDGTAVRREFNIPENAPLVVMVARLEKVKGHELFFAAFKELLAKVPEVRGICACDERTAGAFDATVAAARAAGLNEQVLAFTGMREDIEQIIAAANVVALPSLGSEGSSRVALEAAACGVPLVASDVGCLPEVVIDNKTGVLFPKGLSGALFAALRVLLTCPADAQRMGKAARERAEAEFDEQIMAEKLETIYLAEARRRTDALWTAPK